MNSGKRRINRDPAKERGRRIAGASVSKATSLRARSFRRVTLRVERLSVQFGEPTYIQVGIYLRNRCRVNTLSWMTGLLRMPGMSDRLADNLDRVKADIAAACARVGRSPSEITLVAVTKYAELPWIKRLIDLGVRDLAENRPQQLLLRTTQLPSEVRWHLIGHLQRNKVQSILPHTVMIHSVDSLRLLDRISTVAAELSLQPRVMLEVNVSGEASKDGLSMAELTSQWDAFVAVPNVEIVGLMTMAPLTNDPSAARPVFRGLRQLRDDLASRAAPQVKLNELSMGMSSDFQIAIDEGATLVRIGSRLFEGL